MATMTQGGNSGVTYLSISGGKLRQRLAEDANIPWMVERKLTFWPNEGQIVKELAYSSVEGFITNLEIKSNDFNGVKIISAAVSLDDNVVINFWEMQMDNLTNTLLNVDFREKVKISVYLKEDKTQFSFEQSWDWVKWAVTKDTPMDCPAPTKKMVKWVEKWDFSERSEWFYKKLQELISNTFPNGRITTPEGSSYQAPAKSGIDEEISIEDIPFN